MPYRIDPANRRCVQVERTPGRWSRLKCHPSRAEALAHMRALRINVEEASKMEIRGTFSKVDQEKRLAFGWASVAEEGGAVLVDKQGDTLHVETLEVAVYDYNRRSRAADEMHERIVEDVELVESMMFTPEKIEKMGLDPASVPVGWWVGYYVGDDDLWDGVKAGKRTMFSIRGRGTREEVE